jgi:HD-GYP domain-containing protein (c-di-GMP phosphodiesterase class II)
MVVVDQQDIKGRMISDISTRWAFLIMTVILIVFLAQLGQLENMQMILIWALVIVVPMNLSFYLAVKKGLHLPSFTEYLIRTLDIALITLLVVATGNVISPFYIMYILLITMGGFSLNQKRIIYDFIISAILYVAVLLAFNFSSYLVSIRQVTYEEMASILFVRVSFMALTAWMTHTYIGIVKKREEALAHSNNENVNLYQKVLDLNRNLEQKIVLATREVAERNKENEQLYVQHNRLFIDVTRLLSLAVEARDPFIRGHAERITKYAQAVWEEMVNNFKLQESPETKRVLFMSCMMQNIGRIAVPDTILKKNGPLTPEEWAEVKKYPVIGSHIIKQVDELKPVAEAVLHHREQFDGTGYPQALQGEQIPLVSRIIAVVDAFDAMIHDRPFRPRKENIEAIAEIKRGAKTQFDPTIVQAFINAYEQGKVVDV